MYIVQAKGILICELATTQIFQAILYQLFNFAFNSIILDNPLLARSSLLKFLLVLVLVLKKVGILLYVQFPENRQLKIAS